MEFFQINAFYSAIHLGVENLALLFLACFSAGCIAYCALTIFASSRLSANPMTTVYQHTAAITLGLGLWSICVTMLLSFRSEVASAYDLEWIIISLLMSLLSCYAVFCLLRKSISIFYGGFLLGITIAGLPYIVLCATSGLTISYVSILVIPAILFSAAMTCTALWIVTKYSQPISMTIRYRIIGSMVLCVAICVTYFMNIWTTGLIINPNIHSAPLVDSMSLLWLAALVFILIFCITLFFYTNQELSHEQLIANARLSGMTEMATKMLHNAESKINEINVSAVSIMQRLEHSKLFELHEIGQWMMDHQQDLKKAINHDPQVAQIPSRVITIGEEWRDEQSKIYDELKTLMQNTQFIKDIISTQQSLQYEKTFEQMVSLNTLIEEAILLTGVGLAKHGITIKKECDNVPPFLVDKVKLLQVLVNLFRNAKESLADANPSDKIITVKLKNTNQTIVITIGDNGIGIPPDNMTHIFDHGFTTKKQGHGYGLHASALLMRQLNGMLKASSAGLGHGAIFMLSLPYKTN